MYTHQHSRYHYKVDIGQVLGGPKFPTHPTVAMEIVVNDPEAFPGVVAPVSPAHQVLNNQTHINQSDLIVWMQVTLQEVSYTKMLALVNIAIQ